METDVTYTADVTPTEEEGKLSDQDKDSITAEMDQVHSEE